jgi:hypothetical protein
MVEVVAVWEAAAEAPACWATGWRMVGGAAPIAPRRPLPPQRRSTQVAPVGRLCAVRRSRTRSAAVGSGAEVVASALSAEAAGASAAAPPAAAIGIARARGPAVARGTRARTGAPAWTRVGGSRWSSSRSSSRPHHRAPKAQRLRAPRPNPGPSRGRSDRRLGGGGGRAGPPGRVRGAWRALALAVLLLELPAGLAPAADPPGARRPTDRPTAPCRS